jgi:eukaryotic-like serine/threonine-protein kinase
VLRSQERVAESFPKAFGRYQLVERLAIGGMAELFKAEVSGAHGFKKIVVIKRILPHMARDDHFNSMFVDEAKITARLSHPKICQTLELGNVDGQLYIAMEYVDGLDALAMLRESAHLRRKIATQMAVFMVQEVLDALDFAHSLVDSEGKPLNIVHRDISPSNVLVSRRGDVKLVDFGIAQAAEREQKTQSGTLKGKYGYMAPEQVIGGKLDGRSDLFSAGVLLAEMVMGRRLFTSANEIDVLLMVRDVNLERLTKYGRDIEPALMAILRKALQKLPDDRYQTAAEFRDALGEWLFDNRFRVTPRDLATLVDELYDAAWQRRRAEPVPAPPQAPPLERLANAAAHEATDPLALRANGGRDTRQRFREVNLPSGSSMADAVALAAGDRDGIPTGEALPIESAPIVVIEHPEPAPPPAVARTESLAELDLENIAVDLDDSGLGSDDGLGDLVIDFDPPDTAGAPSVAAGSVALPHAPHAIVGRSGGPYTAEVAFDQLRKNPPTAQQLGARLPQPSKEQIAAARDVTPALAAIEGEPDDSGDLSVTPALRVLCRLAVGRATGLLALTAGAVRKQIYFVDGRPEYVSSNVASELFGEYLVSQKVLSDGELAMALAMMPHYGGKLGDTLVGLGLLKPLDVFRLLTRQVREKLVDVCTWSQGGFAWYDGRKNAREAFPLDLNCYEVLGAGAMAIGLPAILIWVESVADRKYRAVRHAEITPESFELGLQVRQVYNSCDGSRTIREWINAQPAEETRVMAIRVLYLLAMVELIRPADL